MEPELDPALIEKFESFEIKQLLRSSSEFNFKDVEHELRESRKWIRELVNDTAFWNDLTVNKKSQIRDNLNTLTASMEQMANFDVEASNPSENRKNIINTVHTVYTTLNDLFINDLKAHEVYSADPSDLASTARKVKKDIEEAEKEYASILQAIKDASSVAGVAASASFATEFANDSKRHGDQAKNWLYGLLGVALLATAVGYNFLTFLINKLTTKDLTANEELVIKL